MAFGNADHLGVIGTTTASTAALATDKAVTKKWENNQVYSHALLAKIKEGGTNWNKGAIVQGNAALFPLIGSLGTASNTFAGAARSSELTPMTANTTSGLTMARFLIAYHRGNITYTPSELKLLKDGDRGNLIDGRVEQFLETVRQRYSTDIASTTNGSDSKVLGLKYALSGTSATALGGIDASDSDNAWWRAAYTASTGTLTESTLRKAINGSMVVGGKPDLILASNGGGATFDTFDKVMSFVQPSERLVNIGGGVAKYGFNTFMFRGIEVCMDYYLAAGGNNGELLILDSSKFHWLGDVQPESHPDERIIGTGGVEKFYESWNCLGVKNVRAQVRLAGITA